MKLTKLIKTKQLLLLSLLTVPVTGEMVINFNGLPSPWPIGLVSIFVSISSIFLFEGTKINFGLLSKLTLCYSIIRSILLLLSSWNSLRIHGTTGFQYPELVILNVLPLVPLMFAVKKGINHLNSNKPLPEPNWLNRKLEEIKQFLFCHKNSENERDIELFTIPSQQNLGEEREITIEVNQENRNQFSLEEQTKRDKLKKTLEKVYQLKWFCWGLIAITFFWQIVATIIYKNSSNFVANSQFTTNCTATPNNTDYASVHCNDNNFCFIVNKKNLYSNIIIRSLSLTFGLLYPFCIIFFEFKLLKNVKTFLWKKIFPNGGKTKVGHVAKYLLFSFYLFPIVLPLLLILLSFQWIIFPILAYLGKLFSLSKNEEEKEEKEIWEKVKEAPLRNFLHSLISIVCASYLIVVAIQQSKGLNTTGLDTCNINQKLLSSQTGYLSEWANHNWNTTNEAFSKIIRQIALI